MVPITTTTIIGSITYYGTWHVLPCVRLSSYAFELFVVVIITINSIIRASFATQLLFASFLWLFYAARPSSKAIVTR